MTNAYISKLKSEQNPEKNNKMDAICELISLRRLLARKKHVLLKVIVVEAIGYLVDFKTCSQASFNRAETNRQFRQYCIMTSAG
jgi:hypothetical protein